jgi:hypothetical protein
MESTGGDTLETRLAGIGGAVLAFCGVTDGMESTGGDTLETRLAGIGGGKLKMRHVYIENLFLKLKFI